MHSMYYSKYNLLSEIESTCKVYVLTNLLHGQSSLITERNLAKKLQDNEPARLTSSEIEILKDKKFVFDSQEEENVLLNNMYEEFSNSLLSHNPTRQYHILISYDCNLRCIYCFQKKNRSKKLISRDQLQRIFEIVTDLEKTNQRELIERHLKTENTLISIIGGEPLQYESEYLKIISDIIGFAKNNKYDYCITSNGSDLGKFLYLFNDLKYYPGDIQVTLDGPEDIHNSRRRRPSGTGSYKDIIESIDNAVKAGFHISLRINVDSQNVFYLNEISDIIRSYNWDLMDNFHCYVAPVTDHSDVNKNYKWDTGYLQLLNTIITQFENESGLYKLFNLKNFRGFTYIRNIIEKKKPPIPTFWRCEAVLGQYVFDPFGNIYTCFEAAGNEEAKVGTYYPDYKIDETKLNEWNELNTYLNKHCLNCKSRFVCASGCPWHIVKQQSPECLPIEKEISMAWGYFLSDKVLEKYLRADVRE